MSCDIQRNRDMKMPGEKSTERWFYQCTGISRVGVKRRGPDAFHWCPETGQGAVGTNTQEIPPESEEKLL